MRRRTDQGGQSSETSKEFNNPAQKSLDFLREMGHSDGRTSPRQSLADALELFADSPAGGSQAGVLLKRIRGRSGPGLANDVFGKLLAHAIVGWKRHHCCEYRA